ncbi:hypothetical protein NBRC3257_2579 [Gluconobacter thailandicus NBRC 3257]|uniref:Uncharacterized protein n=1 Tax=Gluconobacter thailandicus NBRC 3257 TaxID=1381097 RepID=A0ABQ0IZE6_GLUTH|nr:hypothetical protein NBRC3255_2825 [Gluconobacter thailandicus NBRC 3255]GAD27580.1 hypothetical protein NBRC3257_2579 [Gluconobacter thailandicus NBRC 3257]
MPAITLTGDTSPIGSSLQKIAEIGRNPKKFLNAVGRILTSRNA